LTLVFRKLNRKASTTTVTAVWDMNSVAVACRDTTLMCFFHVVQAVVNVTIKLRALFKGSIDVFLFVHVLYLSETTRSSDFYLVF
jgi:hypothetical protein